MPDAARIVEATRRGAEPAQRTYRRTVADTELTVVMPCLNEAETIATCVRKAQRAMRAAGIVGEVGRPFRSISS